MLAISVGNGWYRGRLGFTGARAVYGDQLGVIVQLDIEFTDGHRQHVGSDETWTVTGSDVLADDLYDGQTIDARRRRDEWYVPFTPTPSPVPVYGPDIEFDTHISSRTSVRRFAVRTLSLPSKS